MTSAKDRPRIGVLISDANPPDIREFLIALKAMAEHRLDYVAYVVTDGCHIDGQLEATRAQRCALAKSACAPYEPLIRYSDIGTISEEPGTAIMANGRPRLLVDPEDQAFQLFRLNRGERLAMMLLSTDDHCRRVTLDGDDDTINKILANIKARRYGFDPALHQVRVLFMGSLTGIPVGIAFSSEEQALLDGGTFALDFMTLDGVLSRLPQRPAHAVTKQCANPFETFRGFLKQHAHEELSSLEQELFDLLFPAFQGTDSGGESVLAQTTATLENWAKENPQDEKLLRRLSLQAGERRPRRFSGFWLPRNRYFAVCADADGYDAQTLAHELRAYRDPVDLGMVEVLDLVSGCTLSIAGHVLQLEAQPAIAVLIHQPERLPDRLRKLEFQRAPGLRDNSELLIYRFPYRVRSATIERTLDLRRPVVRDWFYARFREPVERALAKLSPLPQIVPPTIAHSRFHFENGKPPVPSDFWAMLPTLVNPDLGGGNIGDTGSTFVMIGHWMRQNEVAALIYPSARCDCAAVVENGELASWQGWNLVDYRDAPLPMGDAARATTVVTSPWAWQHLPEDVNLHVAESSSRLAGSFAIQGIVNFTAREYLNQLKALDIARARHGREPPRAERFAATDGLPHRAFQIGTLLLGWLRRPLQGTSAAEVEDVVLELQGLALPYGLYLMTGRVSELWADIKRRRIDISTANQEALKVIDLVARFFESEHAGQDLHRLVRFGADHELLLVCLGGLVDSRKRGVRRPDLDVSILIAMAAENLEIAWLNNDLRAKIRSYHAKVLRTLDSGSDTVADLVREGIQLQHLIYEELRG